MRGLQQETLGLDEVEALRLSDVENLNQESAAQRMGIARITYQRIIRSAHRKVAKALIYGKSIEMRGGDIIMPKLDGTGPQGQGPMTGRGLGRGLRSQAKNTRARRITGGVAECTCPKCGTSTPHTRGTPCSLSNCPKCGTPMRGVFCN